MSLQSGNTREGESPSQKSTSNRRMPRRTAEEHKERERGQIDGVRRKRKMEEQSDGRKWGRSSDLGVSCFSHTVSHQNTRRVSQWLSVWLVGSVCCGSQNSFSTCMQLTRTVIHSSSYISDNFWTLTSAAYLFFPLEANRRTIPMTHQYCWTFKKLSYAVWNTNVRDTVQ